MRNLSSCIFTIVPCTVYQQKHSVFTYIVSYHICPPPLWVFKWSFFWRILCLTSFWVFVPRDEKKQGQSRQSLQMLKNNSNLALGMLNVVDPHGKGARSGMSSQECLIAEQAETWQHSPSDTCSLNLFLFLPTKYAAKHLFIEKKKTLVHVCCYKSLWNNHFEQGRQTRETNGSTATGNGAAVSRTL